MAQDEQRTAAAAAAAARRKAVERLAARQAEQRAALRKLPVRPQVVSRSTGRRPAAPAAAPAAASPAPAATTARPVAAPATVEFEPLVAELVPTAPVERLPLPPLRAVTLDPLPQPPEITVQPLPQPPIEPLPSADALFDPLPVIEPLPEPPLVVPAAAADEAAIGIAPVEPLPEPPERPDPLAVEPDLYEPIADPLVLLDAAPVAIEPLPAPPERAQAADAIDPLPAPPERASADGLDASADDLSVSEQAALDAGIEPVALTPGSVVAAAEAAATASPSAQTLAERAADDIARPWLASYPPGVPETYTYPAVPLTRFLDDAAQDFPDTAAIAYSGAVLTYRQVLDQVDRLAVGLGDRLGARTSTHRLHGERVAVILPPCPQQAIALHAAWRLGAIAVPLDPALDDSVLRAALGDAAPRVIVIADGDHARLSAIISDADLVVVTSLTDHRPLLRGKLQALAGRRDAPKVLPGDRTARLDQLIARSTPSAEQVALDPGDDLAIILYGDPRSPERGVALTHQALVANAFQVRLWLPDVQAGRERVLAAVPPSHAFGLTAGLLTTLLSAGTVLLVDEGPMGLVATVEREQPTLLISLPDDVGAIAEPAGRARRRGDLAALRIVLTWGPAPEQAIEALESRTGARVRAATGLAEAGPVTHAAPVYGKGREGTAGMPLPDTDCRIINGEVQVRGPQLAAGYWQRHADTAAAFDNGWLRTGWRGTIDPDGHLVLEEPLALT